MNARGLSQLVLSRVSIHTRDHAFSVRIYLNYVPYLVVIIFFADSISA